MCGIAGIYRQSSGDAPHRDELAWMVNVLRHRGPDGEGFYVDDNIGLAHARLSIIDLATGEQPIRNEDGTVWVVFNGEIFNYVELRASLERRGHHFYTASDTEVLVHLYEDYGTDFVSHLNGQFAIALYDKTKRQLILCRDRAGILPLFYAEHEGRLLFGSEIKALLTQWRESPRLDPVGLDQVMTFWSTVGAQTLFEGVRQVQPGEMLVVDAAHVRPLRYWDWPFTGEQRYDSSLAERYAEELRSLLSDATRLRLRADVPVGTYLSGGLDSAAVTALMRENGVVPAAFSMRFAQQDLDESDFQDVAGQHLGIVQNNVVCEPGDIAALFSRAIWHTETPILRTAPVPMMLLSKSAHGAGCKVVLTGEGADEVLGGYDIFKETKIRQFWARRPHSAWRPLLLKRLYPYLTISPSRAQAYSEAFFGAGLDAPNHWSFSHLPRWNSTAQCKLFYSRQFNARLSEGAEAVFERAMPSGFSHWRAFERAQYLEAKSLMSGYLLSSQGDRMLMANSVEGRFPYLDHRVIEFACGLHPNYRMHVLREKHLLKMALRDLVPPSILQRHKQPYRAPDIPAFFTGGAADYVDALLSPEAITRCGCFDPQKVTILLNKARSGRAVGYRDNMAFVGILSTQLWHSLFVEQFARFKSGGSVFFS